ncbi:hypothetical protein [Ornithinimicrobium cavernae]|uniref:hypothetical protein n=1 Tax=Ornithinimicrobium cavernae TaxID=2666047 RepID=UPI000D68B7D1|nr:hypothetical protein [Ornithinimicrobium cavernae]
MATTPSPARTTGGPRRITKAQAQRVLADPASVPSVLGADAEPLEPEDAATVEEALELVRARASAVVRTGTARPRVHSAAPTRTAARPQVRSTVGRGSDTVTKRGPRARRSEDVVREAPTRTATRPQVRSTVGRGSDTVTKRGPRARRSEDVVRERAEAAAGPKPSGTGKPLPQTLEFWHRSYHPALDGRDAQFRRQRVGAGKLTGTELSVVTDAYVWAYFMAGSARNELRSWGETPQDIPALWNGSIGHPAASLGHWFGERVSDRSDMRRIMDRIQDVLEAWTSAFSSGFRTGFPVFIRRKERDPVFGSPPARHVARNTVELTPDYFELGPAAQAAVLLHEMGHWAIGMTNPRDERSDLCEGGWNRPENMCYHTGKNTLRSEDEMLRESNPRVLAEAFDAGSESAGKTARNNIDNYVAFMWNRFIDRTDSVLYVPTAGSVRPDPSPVGKGKPT